MRHTTFAAALLLGGAHAWLPEERDLAAFNLTARFEQLGKRFQPGLSNGVSKIRGVNFGGWLISEPWMMCNEWAKMGCRSTSEACPGGSVSEFDCMSNHYKGNNRDAGNKAFAEHWRTWIDPGTVQSVHDVGLNTIRIPIGYWSYTDIVDKASEPFADGNLMLPYLDAVVQKAADLGIYVIIDFHGAPGGQAKDPFTGQNALGFFNDYNYGRAYKWLAWMANRIHTNKAYASVGMIEVLNEPAAGQGSLVNSFYPGALMAVRDAESKLNVPDNKKLHVQFMSAKWGSGDPRTNANVKNAGLTAFDDHNYVGFGFSGSDRGDQTKLMQRTCTDSRLVGGEDYRITGEWSMTSDVDWHDSAFFKKFFTAQQQLYEKPGMNGWVYWTWKTELNDPRWTYSYATYLKYVPTDAAGLEKNVYQDVCAGFR